jgi:hypothetical protein
MRSFMFKAALPLLLVSVLIVTPACIFDPKEDVKLPPPVEVEWPDMTQRDDVVETILLAYEYPKEGESVSRYNALLHSEYFFGLDPGDVGVGGSPILTRAEETYTTERIFELESLLDLTIAETGTWNSYPEIDGEPCIDCWESTREYRIRAQFGDEDTTYQSPAGRASVIIIVARDENDDTKWVLRAMYDTLSN